MLRGPACQLPGYPARLPTVNVIDAPSSPPRPRGAAVAAGLKQCKAQGVVFTRQAPLDHAARSFFTAYLENLRLRVGPHLEPSLRALFDRLSNLRSRLFLLSSPNLTVTCLNQVVIGIKSSPRSMRKT